MEAEQTPTIEEQLEEARVKIIGMQEVHRAQSATISMAAARIKELEEEVDAQAEQYIKQKAEANKLRVEVRQLRRELPKGKKT